MARQAILKYTAREALNKLLVTDSLWSSSAEMTGYNVIHKYGHNLDIDSTFETIWSEGTNYAFIPTATVLKISSSSADDTSNGTGARTITIQGLDANYFEQSETITLNGQTAVNTSNTYFRIHRMFVETAGSGQENAGTIYAGTGTVTTGVPADKYATIPVGYNQTMMAVYTIPCDKTAYMTMFYAQPDSQASYQVQMLTGRATDSGVLRVRNELHAFQNQAIFNYKPYLKLTEKTDIQLRAKTGTANVEFAGGFSLLLIDNLGI